MSNTSLPYVKPFSLRKTCFLHLWNIAKIRDSLSQKGTEILVHAFISSKLDSCNSLLYGLPQSLIDRLQAVQNCAARPVTRSRKHDHITPILKQLHWLPVYSRIKYKVRLLTFKALHGLAPSYITEMLQPYKQSRSLRADVGKYRPEVCKSEKSKILKKFTK